jgi:hypothetical protein
MKRGLTVPALFFALSLFIPATTAAQQRGPSTREERARAVELARRLETDPFNAEAREWRRWLLTWIDEVPDITVNVCNLLSPLSGSNRRFAREIVIQVIFTSAAYIIENPDKAAIDDDAAYIAGVRGALKAYESILKERPEARWHFLDDLLQKRDKGELDDWVRRTADQKCAPDRQPV